MESFSLILTGINAQVEQATDKVLGVLRDTRIISGLSERLPELSQPLLIQNAESEKRLLPLYHALQQAGGKVLIVRSAAEYAPSAAGLSSLTRHAGPRLPTRRRLRPATTRLPRSRWIAGSA